jgi:hypothetical protein
MSLLGVLAHLTDVPEASPMLATMIGLGVGIDYALFVVTRHRELLHEGYGVHAAAAKANATATAGQAVLFAGVTVVIAICGLQVSGIPAIGIMASRPPSSWRWPCCWPSRSCRPCSAWPAPRSTSCACPALVTGETAMLSDVSAKLTERLP